MAGDNLQRAALEAQQLSQLRRLLGALETNPFYRRKWAAAGIQPPFSVKSLADFSQRFPATTKLELVENQSASPPFGDNLTFPLSQYTRYHQTSGVTGRPLRWLDTPESWNWMVQNWIEIFGAASVRADDRVFFAFSFGPFIGFWLAFEAAAEIGCLCIPGGGMTSIARLRAILENRATVLCCTPTYALHLAETAEAEDIALRGGCVRLLIAAGEPGASIPATRARLEQLWPGARVFDHHGMTETGPVTFECPARPGVLHVIESGYFAEVIGDALGKPAAPGETGELILTALGRIGSPLLRYRTGDLVRLAAVPSRTERCACGRCDLALEGGILGRNDDMVTIRGVNVYPTAIEAILRPFAEIAEYRVQISRRQALAEIAVQFEPKPACADASQLARQLERALHSALNLRVPVRPAPINSLPRFEMKAKRWHITDD